MNAQKKGPLETELFSFPEEAGSAELDRYHH